MAKASYIQLHFQPNVELISSARQFVADFYAEVVGDAAVLSRIQLATHELLENAVKYAVDGVTQIRIDVAEEATLRRIVIRTTNRAALDHREVLRTTIEEASSAPDAFLHYQQVMLKNARRKGGSGLGLARIRAEADMTMVYGIDGDEVSITLEAEIPPRAAAPALAALGG